MRADKQTDGGNYGDIGRPKCRYKKAWLLGALYESTRPPGQVLMTLPLGAAPSCGVSHFRKSWQLPFDIYANFYVNLVVNILSKRMFVFYNCLNES